MERLINLNSIKSIILRRINYREKTAVSRAGIPIREVTVKDRKSRGRTNTVSGRRLRSIATVTIHIQLSTNQ